VATLTPLGRERHAGKGWRKPGDFRFAAHRAIVPLTASEMPRAMLAMPIGFVEAGGIYVPVGILSLVPGRNHFVGPDGSWLGTYTPSDFRSHPFRLQRVESSQELALCIEDEEQNVIEDGSRAEPFFDPAGELAASTRAVFEFLVQIDRMKKQTAELMAMIAAAGLFLPWNITVKNVIGDQHLGGLFRIDEKGLNDLPDEALAGLRHALPVMYTQLLSMGQLTLLQHLARLHDRLGAPAAKQESAAIQGLQMADDGLLRFD
jgi:hypothetical protein